MLNYFMDDCQYKMKNSFLLMLFFILYSCGSQPIKKINFVNDGNNTPFWLKVPERYSFKEWDNNFIFNPFFDFSPFLQVFETTEEKKRPAVEEDIFDEDEILIEEDNKQNPEEETLTVNPVESDNLLNYFIVTPYESEINYSFDIISGKHYSTGKFCKQDDVWKPGRRFVGKPEFVIGIVPRILDQLGLPQKIIVYGSSDNLKKIDVKSINLHKAKIIGGVIEQYCEIYPCSKKNDWLSKQVLIGVAYDDSEFKGVNSIRDLKERVDWGYLKTFLEVYQGRTIKEVISYKKSKAMKQDMQWPAYRIFGEFDRETAFNFLKTKGHVFNTNELETMKNSCHKLYDVIKKEVSNIKATKVYKQGVFAKFFFEFFDKYSDRYQICSKYVRAANINFDNESHSFFTYLTGFVKLHQLGMIYVCGQKTWVKNVITSEGKLQFDVKNIYNYCTDEQIDIGFKLIPMAMKDKAKTNLIHFKYLTYDYGIIGTHNKIYSWVYDQGKINLCSDWESNKFANRRLEVFPNDILWQRFYKDIALDRLKGYIR